ncbi:MAG: nucleotidyltransferase family protein [Flavobacteriaceae bacterium]|nr:nucleotidyltransferase family protein [Flavobacteriaceae bacterium]
MNKDIAILIMAAGASSRMEAVKQLLPWNGKTLLEHVYDNCRTTSAAESYVVLGAFSDQIINDWNAPSEHLMINPEWQQGLGNSIAFGVRNILNNKPQLKGILIVLGDQPLIDATYLDRLISYWQKHDTEIVATRYGDKNGVPALFDQRRFKDLLALEGERGAQQMLSSASEKIATIDGSAHIADIDTLSDYERIKRMKANTGK